VKLMQVKIITITCILVVICLGASVALFEMSQVVLLKVANTRPISSIINRLQSYSFPVNDRECLVELKRQDAEFRLQANFEEKSGCKVENAVRLARAGKLNIDNAPLLTCSMATQLIEFERDRLQPIAKRLLGSEIKRLKHIGSYNCRTMRQYKGVLSQHAFANALDVSEFYFEDGQSISVQRDWKTNGPKSQFLREISSAACDTFRVSVSPDGDANHWNHLHLDTGVYRSCR
jgi:hypothetical protein